MGELGGTLNLAVIKTMPAAALPSLIVELAALQAAAAARMAAEMVQPIPVPEYRRETVWLDARAAARVLHRSVSWVQKNGRNLPGFRQLAGPGSPIEFDGDALRRYAVSGVAS